MDILYENSCSIHEQYLINNTYILIPINPTVFFTNTNV